MSPLWIFPEKTLQAMTLKAQHSSQDQISAHSPQSFRLLTMPPLLWHVGWGWGVLCDVSYCHVVAASRWLLCWDFSRVPTTAAPASASGGDTVFGAFAECALRAGGAAGAPTVTPAVKVYSVYHSRGGG